MHAAPTAPRVLGRVVDHETRCAHYHGELDIIALRFVCCGEYYPCFECHAEAADHPSERWGAADRWRDAVLCGVCRHELSIETYLHVNRCPRCEARFNPGCRLHHELYFDFAGA